MDIEFQLIDFEIFLADFIDLIICDKQKLVKR